jgi:hypothetical protein
MTHLRSPRSWLTDAHTALRSSEVVLLALGALQAVACLVGVAAATAGLCAWLVAICLVDWAIMHLGDSPIATAAIIGAFVVSACVPGTLLGALWVATKDSLDESLSNLGRRLEAPIEQPSPTEETERECVEAIRECWRAGLRYVETIVGQLRAENSEVTLQVLYNRIDNLAAKAEDPEWRPLASFGECLYSLKLPAAEPFDRAVAQGACPVKLLQEILGC